MFGAVDRRQRVDEMTQARQCGICPLAGITRDITRLLLDLGRAGFRLLVALARDDGREGPRDLVVHADGLVPADIPESVRRAVGADGQLQPLLEHVPVFSELQRAARVGECPERDSVFRRNRVHKGRRGFEHGLAFAHRHVVAIDDQHEEPALCGVGR